MDEPALRIVLLGKTGVGKSASGNTILAENVFESRLSFKSVTTECSEVTKEVFGKKVSVVDTPGVSSSNEEPIKTMCQQALESSTPCLFLTLIEIGRFTEEDHKVANSIERILGREGMEKCYILFTKGDALGNSTLDDFIFEDGNPLPEIIHSLGGKYHVFNNETGDQDQVKELLIRSGHLTSIITNTNARRIILLGRSGVGKSATGNTILGLRGPDQFKSTCSLSPVTCESEAKTKMVDGREITVIDTPGLSDKKKSSKEVYDEVMKASILSRPGPHAFILVFELNRLEKKDLLMIDLLKCINGKGVLNHTLVLFTHSDNLCGQNIKDLINENETAKSLLDKVGGRYCVFDNKARHMKQVRDLLKIMDEMVPHEGSTYYKGPIENIIESIFHEERNKKGQRHRPSPESERTPLIEPSPSVWQRFKMWCARLWERVMNFFIEICTAPGNVVSERQIRTLLHSTIGSQFMFYF